MHKRISNRFCGFCPLELMGGIAISIVIALCLTEIYFGNRKSSHSRKQLVAMRVIDESVMQEAYERIISSNLQPNASQKTLTEINGEYPRFFGKRRVLKTYLNEVKK